MNDEYEREVWEVISLGPPAPGWMALIFCTTETGATELKLTPVVCWGVCRYGYIRGNLHTGEEEPIRLWTTTVQGMILIEDELLPFESLDHPRDITVGLVPPGVDPMLVWNRSHPNTAMPPITDQRVSVWQERAEEAEATIRVVEEVLGTMSFETVRDSALRMVRARNEAVVSRERLQAELTKLSVSPCSTCKHCGPEEHEKGRECRHPRMGTDGCGSRYRRPDDHCSGWERREP